MSENFENPPKRHESEENQLFRFKDQYGEFHMPRNIKQFIDQQPTLSWVGPYLYNLIHVASAQQEEYENQEHGAHFIPTLKEGDDPVEISNALEEISKRYEGSKGMDKFTKWREEVLKACGSGFVSELEKYLGVDSQGLEAKDTRPLLGVDLQITVALSHYVQKAGGYEELR